MRISNKELQEFIDDPPGINYDKMQVLYLEKRLNSFTQRLLSKEGVNGDIYVYKQLIKFEAKLRKKVDEIEAMILENHDPTPKPILFPADDETMLITKEGEIILSSGLDKKEWKRAFRDRQM